MMGRTTKPRITGRHRPDAAGTTLTIPNPPQEASVTNLSNAAIDAIWSTALAHNDTAARASRAAVEARRTYHEKAESAASLHEEGNRLIAQGRQKLAEAEEAKGAAESAKTEVLKAAAAAGGNATIAGELKDEVDRHVAAKPNAAHPAERRPMPVVPNDIDPSDPLRQRAGTGPVSDATAEFPPVPDDPQAANFQGGGS